MKYKLNFCMVCALSMTLVCTAMENTSKSKIFLKNDYITELLYAELPIVMLLGSKTVKVRPDALQTEMKTIPSGAQVKLNNTLLGLSVGTSTHVKLAYYDAGSDRYYGGLCDISDMIKEIKADQPKYLNYNAIITIHCNPFKWSFSTTWKPKKLIKKMNYTEQFIAKNAVSTKPELLIDTNTEPGASFALISNNAITK